MDEIVIGFSTTKSLISKVIRWFEKTPYSHVYIRFYSENIGRWLVYHANHDNLNFQNLPNLTNENEIIYEYLLPVTPEQKMKIVQYCVDNVHRRYGLMTLLGIALVRSAKDFFKRDISNPFVDKEKTQICSELAGRVLTIAQIPIDLNVLETEGPRYIHECVIKARLVSHYR